MRTILTAIRKDLLCLWRDPGALAVLFIMPAVLVVVISLVQNDTLTAMSGSDTTLILVNESSSPQSAMFVEALRDNGFVQILETTKGGEQYSREAALVELEKGRVDAVLGVKPGSITMLMPSKNDNAQTPQGSGFLLDIKYRHDLLEASRMAIDGAVKISMVMMRDKALGLETPKQLPIETSYYPDGARKEPLSASQQNLPAWIMFAMFFMVLPVSSGVINERRSGTLDRLLSLRVSYTAMLSGKIGAYVFIALLQAAVVGLVGWYVLPLLGVDRPDYALRPVETGVFLLLSALAASGAGVALGTVASTEEQASVFGALSVVLFSAVGGIMVPLFAMPRMLRELAVVSPLNWGHQGLIQSLVYDAAWPELLWPAGRLILFFLACLALAVAYQKRRHA